jgi:hypothetical protein
MIPARRGPSVGGDGEPTVNKEEVTHGATSNKRGSMEEARGRGVGARAASTSRHRGERGRALLIPDQEKRGGTGCVQ